MSQRKNNLLWVFAMMASATVLTGCVATGYAGDGYYNDAYNNNRGGYGNYGSTTMIYNDYNRPPPRRIEVRPAAPAPNYYWNDGAWNWNGRQYEWTQGRWYAPGARAAPIIRPSPPVYQNQRPEYRPAPQPYARPPEVNRPAPYSRTENAQNERPRHEGHDNRRPHNPRGKEGRFERNSSNGGEPGIITPGSENIQKTVIERLRQR